MHDHERWAGQLSALLDEELSPSDREDCEAHVEVCPECRAVLDDLRRIVAAAPAYRGTPPARDLWPAIAEAIDQSRALDLAARRKGWWRAGRPALLAAGIGLAVIAAGSAWVAIRSAGPGSGAGTPVLVLQPAARLTPDEAYDVAMDDLRGVLSEGRDRLDTATVRIIEENLALIDRAIAEAEAAVQADPSSVELRTWVEANQRRKLELLRRAATAVRLAADS